MVVLPLTTCLLLLLHTTRLLLLLQVLSAFAPRFGGYEQQDAQALHKRVV